MSMAYAKYAETPSMSDAIVRAVVDMVSTTQESNHGD